MDLVHVPLCGPPLIFKYGFLSQVSTNFRKPERTKLCQRGHFIEVSQQHFCPSLLSNGLKSLEYPVAQW